MRHFSKCHEISLCGSDCDASCKQSSNLGIRLLQCVFYPPFPSPLPPPLSCCCCCFFFWHGAEKPPNTEERIKSHARRIHPLSSLLFISLLSIFLFQVSASGRGEGVVRRKRRRREMEVKQIEMAGAKSVDQGRCQQCSP